MELVELHLIEEIGKKLPSTDGLTADRSSCLETKTNNYGLIYKQPEPCKVIIKTKFLIKQRHMLCVLKVNNMIAHVHLS